MMQDDLSTALNLVQEYFPDLPEKEFQAISGILADFDTFLEYGLRSATLLNFCDFLRLHSDDPNYLNQARSCVEKFFLARGDLCHGEELCSTEILLECFPAVKQHHFSKSLRQAKKAVTLTRIKGITRSVGTENTYRDCLKLFSDFLKRNHLPSLNNVSMDIVTRYLTEISCFYGPKSCDKHRQSIQAFLRARGDLAENERLPKIESKLEQHLGHRAYTLEQVELLCEYLSDSASLSVRLAYKSGLRAHELFTLRPITELSPDIRFYRDGQEKRSKLKFSGRDKDGVLYVVQGKGGLIREVMIPSPLAAELEMRRLAEPVIVTDRGIHYEQHYDLLGGQRLTNLFGRTSKRILGWSTGLHGLRHSYAQERLQELITKTNYHDAKETVSQELGHFRPSITDVYLR